MLENNYFVIGQGVVDGGHGMSSTIPVELHDRCLELPVFEESQTGIALGMALVGENIISIYPRFDFFISGLSQLINHSDKVSVMSGGLFSPNIIFRVGVGAKVPLDAGPQHTNNYTSELRSMLTNVCVHEIPVGANPNSTYREIEKSGGLHLVVEHMQCYGDMVEDS